MLTILLESIISPARSPSRHSTHHQLQSALSPLCPPPSNPTLEISRALSPSLHLWPSLLMGRSISWAWPRMRASLISSLLLWTSCPGIRPTEQPFWKYSNSGGSGIFPQTGYQGDTVKRTKFKFECKLFFLYLHLPILDNVTWMSWHSGMLRRLLPSSITLDLSWNSFLCLKTNWDLLWLPYCL